jgi:hypothetical protein
MEWHFHAEVISRIPLTNVTLLDIIMCIFKQGRPKVTCTKNFLDGELARKISPHMHCRDILL